jgi:hypothetical protein
MFPRFAPLDLYRKAGARYRTFVRADDARTARRQFQVSTMLVLELALAAVALEMLTQLAPPIAAGRSSALNASSPHIAETLLDIRG